MIYRWGEGQWSWLFHRVSGVGILIFLLIHILDTTLIRLGPEAYNHAVSIYKHPWFRPAELLLAAAVLYHAGNGVRIILYDLFPGTTQYHKQMFVGGSIIFALVYGTIAYFMVRGLF